jgi:hypothetical protein
MDLKTVTSGDITQADWTGTGQYFMYLQVSSSASSGKMYIYTGDKSWDDLGVSSSTSVSELNSKVPKYNIPEGNSTLPFDQFKITP